MGHRPILNPRRRKALELQCNEAFYSELIRSAALTAAVPCTDGPETPQQRSCKATSLLQRTHHIWVMRMAVKAQ